MILPVPHQTRRAGDSGPRLVVRVSFDGERKVPTEGRKDVESWYKRRAEYGDGL